MTATGKRAWLALTFFMASLWVGLLLGVSFLATIAKFSAPIVGHVGGARYCAGILLQYSTRSRLCSPP